MFSEESFEVSMTNDIVLLYMIPRIDLVHHVIYDCILEAAIIRFDCPEHDSFSMGH